MCTVVQQFYIDITDIKPNSACLHRNLIQPALTASLFQTVHTLHSLYRSQYRNILAVTSRFCKQGGIQFSFLVQMPIPPQAYRSAMP